MSNTIQNALLEILAHAVQGVNASEARERTFFGLTVDQTADVNTSE